MFTQLFWWSLQFGTSFVTGYAIAQTIMFLGYDPGYMFAPKFYGLCFIAGFVFFAPIVTVNVDEWLERRRERRSKAAVAESERAQRLDDLLSRDAGRERLPRP